MNQVQLTLKNVAFLDELSEETLCFTATVYVNGFRAFRASNRGHGGCNDYEVFDRSLWNKAAEWVNTLPPKRCDLFPDGLKQDMDIVIGDLVADHLERAERKKAYAKGVAFLNPDKPDSIAWYPFPRGLKAAEKAQVRIKWEVQTRQRHPEYRLIRADGTVEQPDLKVVK